MFDLCTPHARTRSKNILTLTQKLWRYILSSFRGQKAFKVFFFKGFFFMLSDQIDQIPANSNNSLLDYYHIMSI